MSKTLWRADNNAWGTSERMRMGKGYQCVHGLGRTDYAKCAERCRAGNETCHRSGSACARGAFAMTKVPVQ